MLEAAATDPYTQCGMEKLICVSRIDDFLIHHLPDKYVGELGIGQAEFRAQVAALLEVACEGTQRPPLFSKHPARTATRFNKNYYEPTRSDLIALIPPQARSVLSVGCGWGATEQSLVDSGRRVVAVPWDPIISAHAEAKGVEIVTGDLRTALSKLQGEKFNALILSNILQLAENPSQVLALCAPLLSDRAIVIAAVPNLASVRVLWKRLRGIASYRMAGNYSKSGVHFTSHWTVKKWLRHADLRVDRLVHVLPERAEALCRRSLGVITPFLSTEIVAIAQLVSVASVHLQDEDRR
jgi:2-polyprenyl-3-methyl-5-hydroxy-6-metoxy-1,4-benzoquinol methylase